MKKRVKRAGSGKELAPGEHIRVVPLHQPAVPVAPAVAKFTYRGGPLIPNVEVFTIFWGEPMAIAFPRHRFIQGLVSKKVVKIELATTAPPGGSNCATSRRLGDYDSGRKKLGSGIIAAVRYLSAPHGIGVNLGESVQS